MEISRFTEFAEVWLNIVHVTAPKHLKNYKEMYVTGYKRPPNHTFLTNFCGFKCL